MVEAAQQRGSRAAPRGRGDGKFVRRDGRERRRSRSGPFGPGAFPQVLETRRCPWRQAPLLLDLRRHLRPRRRVPACAGTRHPHRRARGHLSGARHGLLIRGGDVLERTHTLDTVVFDKTGTLTVGRPAVKRAVVADGVREEDVLAMAAAVERNSRQPLALAVAAAAESNVSSPRLSAAEDTFRQEPGAGASAIVGGVVVAVGTKSFASPSKPVPDDIAAHTSTVHPGQPPCTCRTTARSSVCSRWRMRCRRRRRFSG